MRELGPRLRRLEPAAWTLGALLAFVCYLRISRTLATNSDGASQALQAWDMLHGNLVGDVDSEQESEIDIEEDTHL